MSNDTHPSVEQQLIDYRIKCDMAFSDREENVITQQEYEAAIKRQGEISVAAINDLRRADMEYVIGSNEPEFNTPQPELKNMIRNRHRESQRTRMNERLNGIGEQE